MKVQMKLRVAVWVMVHTTALLVPQGAGQAEVEDDILQLRKELAEMKKELESLRQSNLDPPEFKDPRRR